MLLLLICYHIRLLIALITLSGFFFIFVMSITKKSPVMTKKFERHFNQKNVGFAIKSSIWLKLMA